MTLALWIDPADDNVVTLSVDEITAIADKSPAGNDVSAPATGPDQVTVAGKRAMDFVSGPLTRTTGAGLTNMDGPDVTVIAAFQDDGVASPAGDYQVIVSQSDTVWSADGSGWRIQKPDGFTRVEGSVGGWAATDLAINDGDTVGEMTIGVMEYSDSQDNINIWQDGVWTARAIRAITAGFSHDLHIGEQVAPGTNHYSDGNIGDIIVFDGVMRSDQRQRVEGYLAHKWNVIGRLPNAHPFRYEAPDIVLNPILLLSFDGSDGDTTYTSDDDSARTVTFLGTAVLTDSQSKFDNTSLLLDGNSDSVTVPHNADLAMGTGNDMTVEFWYYRNVDAGVSQTLLNKGGEFGVTFPNWAIIIKGGDDLVTAGTYTTGGNNSIAESTTAIAVGEWYHIAMTWEGATETSKIFINGVLEDTDATGTGTPFSANTGALQIGHQLSASSDYADGLFDHIRISDSIIYKNNFTPPKRPFRKPVSASLIANFKGPDTATSYTSEDAGARTATFAGNAQIDVAQFKFDGSSLLLDGTGDYVTFPDDAQWDLAADDFTVEFWVRWSADPTTGTEYIISHWNAQTSNRGWTIAYDNDRLRLAYSTDGIGVSNIFANISVAAGTWYHVAVCRYDDILTMFFDGTVVNTVPFTATIFSNAETLDIGSLIQASGRLVANDFTGHVQGFRIVKGTSLYSKFTVPEIPFSSVSDDSELLINFDGADGATAYTTDDAVGRILGFVGTAELDDAERRVGATSLYLPAVADAVKVPDAADLALGSGDWTIDFFIRPSALGAFNFFFEQRIDGAAQVRPTLYYNTSALRFFVNGADRIIGGALSTNVWTHVAIVKFNGVTKMYYNGVQTGSSYTDGNTYLQGAIGIGAQVDWASGGVTGWIDMFRWNVGKALYGGDFDVPVALPGEPII